MESEALQDRYSPDGICFGCGPRNAEGLRIKSMPRGDEVVATWHPAKHHEAWEGALAGGIAGTLLDCHSNWTAAYHLMRRANAARPPTTVTAEYAVKFFRPTPTDGPIELVARPVSVDEHRAVIDAELRAGGEVCATCRGTFVAVKPGHPAYHRW